jgi:hypothetical protein
MEVTVVATRFDGFYIVRYEGLSEDGKWGFGTLVVKDGKIYGGDSLSWLWVSWKTEEKWR